MELWMWILGGAVMIGSLIFGVFMGRSTGEDSEGLRSRAKSLEVELGKVQQDYSAYKENVTNHFRTTADLVNQMTSSYKAVYEHLANSSQELCPGESLIEMEDSPRLTKGTTVKGEPEGGNGEDKAASSQSGSGGSNGSAEGQQKAAEETGSEQESAPREKTESETHIYH
jgi:uncharacterized membrane-anchored protein YhcB (DUF1043 family)